MGVVPGLSWRVAGVACVDEGCSVLLCPLLVRQGVCSGCCFAFCMTFFVVFLLVFPFDEVVLHYLALYIYIRSYLIYIYIYIMMV